MLSTKAITLENLSQILTSARINNLVWFTYQSWTDHPVACISRVQSLLQGTVAVRSSAISEDTLSTSNAGAYHSELGIPSDQEELLASAIQRVFVSYVAKESTDPANQVLVQEQSSDVVLSGVCTTRSLDNAPYYVVTYSEGSDTTAVTSGERSQVIKLLRETNQGEAKQIPARFKPLMNAIREIETFIPNQPLDIEFGQTSQEEILIFQVRALVVGPYRSGTEDTALYARIGDLQSRVEAISDQVTGLHGESTILADMTDWNPAEMIGDRASDLAYSLYNELITGEVWSSARSSQGYLDVGARPLVHLIGNKPYVDVRASFNSFLPADLPAELQSKLLNFYLAKFRQDPAKQDKVEFEILCTCYDASFPRRSQELLAHGFTADEVMILRASLLRLTNNLLNIELLEQDLEATRRIDGLLEQPATGLDFQSKIAQALRYLELCKKYGILPFARLARLGFVSAAILKGFVPDVLTNEDYDSFYLTVHTVARDLLIDSDLLSRGQLPKNTFTKKYGHLRPGTYDITSLRYDEQELQVSAPRPKAEAVAELSRKTARLLWHALREHGLRGTVLELFSFARAATEAREEAKFHFTKLLSESLKLFAEAGQALGFSREELSLLRVEDFRSAVGLEKAEVTERWNQIIKSRTANLALDSQIELPPVIFGPQDLDVVVPFTARPSFITQKAVTAEVAILGEGSEQVAVTGKIVVLERGDPGYDWIFTQQPAGLITKYGGAGSHMAIRCNEFALPAAIGCGDKLYRLAKSGGPITLDCRTKAVKPGGLGLISD